MATTRFIIRLSLNFFNKIRVLDHHTKKLEHDAREYLFLDVPGNFFYENYKYSEKALIEKFYNHNKKFLSKK